MPTIRLATDDDLRQISSQHLEPIFELPWLYIPTEDPNVMRAWGVARSDGDGAVQFWEKDHPGSLVSPRHAGQFADRGDLLYHGAEPAADFSPPGASA